LAHDEKVVELARQIFVIVVGDAPHREHVRIVRRANGGDGARLHVHGQRPSGLAESHLVFRAQHHFIGSEDSSTVDAKLAGQFVVPEFLQAAATADNLARAALNLYDDTVVRHRLEALFAAMTDALSADTATLAAEAVVAELRTKGVAC